MSGAGTGGAAAGGGAGTTTGAGGLATGTGGSAATGGGSGAAGARTMGGRGGSTGPEPKAVHFHAGIAYPAGPYPQSVASADVDRDGKPDLVAADAPNDDGHVSVLRNNGDGTFGDPVLYPVGQLPLALVVADLDGDGSPDVVTANSRGRDVSVLLNDGHGAFAAEVRYAVGTSPCGIAAGDLDGDGRPELVVANAGDGTLSILINRGGTFIAGPPIRVGVNSLTSPAMADVDRDGRIDIVVGGHPIGLAKDVGLLLNRGGFTFSQLSDTSGTSPGTTPVVAFSAVDLNHDGAPDLVAREAEKVSLLINDGHGVFTVTEAFSATTYGPAPVPAADLNGDGNPDLVVPVSDYPALMVLTGDGTGHIASFERYIASYAPEWAVVADFDGDGRIDVAVEDQFHLDVFRNLGGGKLAQPGIGPANGRAGVTFLDADGDGLTDLVSLDDNGDASSVAVRLRKTDGSFAAPLTSPLTPGSIAVASGDLDGDGRLDLAVINQTTGRLGVLGNQGRGRFAPVVEYVAGGTPVGLVLADLNGDRARDVVVGCSGGLVVFWNHGDGTFAPAQAVAADAGTGSVAAADFDGDGDLELVVGSGETGSVQVVDNLGSGQFAPAREIHRLPPSAAGMPTMVSFVAATDLDGDQRPDVVFGNYSADGSVIVLRNLGGGAFGVPDEYLTSWGPTSIATGDLNADHVPDLALSSYSGAVSVLLGRGDGTFARPTSYAAGTTLASVNIVDYAGDARQEIVAVDYFSGLLILSADPP
jgi:hypothetical protein